MTSVQLALFETEPETKYSDVAKVAEVLGDGFDVRKFVENFEVLVEAVGGTKRLRELILKLAVQGRLVQQRTTDGTAADLFAHIEQKRALLVAEGKGSKFDSFPLLSEDEMPFPVPSSWCWARFGEVTICRDGQRVPVSKDERAGRRGPYSYYGASGVIDSVDDFIFDEPLLLIGEDGANLLNRSTPIAFIATGKYWVNNHAHVLDSANLDMLRYLTVFVNSIDLTPYVTGTAQPKMNQAKMNAIPVAVPPLAEQKRIVAKVDQLMKLCDDLEARQTKKREIGTRLTKSTLEALITTEGAEEFDAAWKRVVENFEVLIDRAEKVEDLRRAILGLALHGRLLKPLVSAGNGIPNSGTVSDSDENNPTLPARWRWVAVQEIAACVLGKMLDKSKHTKGRKRPYLRNLNVRWGAFDLSNLLEMYFEDDELDRYGALPGDVLICEGGEPGRAAVWTDHRPMLIQKAIHRVRPSRAVDPQWIVMNLRYDTWTARLDRFFTGATIQHFTGKALASYTIRLPPLAEQKQIIAKVDQLMKLCDDLEAALRRAEDRAAKLTEAVVAEIAVR